MFPIFWTTAHLNVEPLFVRYRLAWGLFFLVVFMLVLYIYKTQRDKEKSKILSETDWLRRKDLFLRRLFTSVDWADSIENLSLNLIKVVKTITGANRAYIHLFDVGNEFLYLIATPEDLPYFADHSIISMTTGRLSQIVNTHQPIINKNISIPHPDDTDISSLVDGGCVCGIFLPMLAKDEVVGLCSILFASYKDWTEKDIEYYMDIGCLTGTVIANKRKTDFLRELAVLQERKRLSQELHDNFSQLTSGLTIRAEAAVLSGEEGNAEKTLYDLQRIVGTAHEIQSSLREEMLGLRSSVAEKCDLVPLLQDCVERFNRFSNIPVSLDEINLPPSILAPSQVGVQFIRIIQESLSNIRRHAHASRVEIRVIQMSHRLRVEIEDNGVGFEMSDIARDRLGLRIIRERAHDVGGTIMITSVPNHGTCIQFDLPLVSQKRNIDGKSASSHLTGR